MTLPVVLVVELLTAVTLSSNSRTTIDTNGTFVRKKDGRSVGILVVGALVGTSVGVVDGTVLGMSVGISVG